MLKQDNMARGEVDFNCIQAIPGNDQNASPTNQTEMSSQILGEKFGI